MNNDFGSLVMRFANDFHSWLRHSWKLLANRLTRDPKIVIHGNSCIILYIRCHYNVVKYSMILHTPVRYAEVDHKSEFKLTKYIEYLHFVGKLRWKLFRKLTKSYAVVLDINSLWPRDITWWHRSVSTLAQVKACCLTAPSHYLNQCWPLFSEILAHSPERNFAVSKLLFCIMC